MNPALFRRRRRDGSIAGSSGDPTLPPDDQASVIWAVDPDIVGAGQWKIGPTGTVTTPVQTSGAAGYYTYGATDRIDFGDTLDSTWTAGSFTVYIAINPSAGDLAAPNRTLVQKGLGSSGHAEWNLQWAAAGGKPRLVVWYGNGTSNLDLSTVTTQITAAKHVITAVYDRSLAFGSRCKVYVDGVAVAQTTTSGGVDGTVSDTTEVLRIGYDGSKVPVSVMSYVYAYNTAHSATNVTNNYNWIHSTKGW